jgi:inhibitor of KinA sporulation pathway (predicted exonuclease)
MIALGAVLATLDRHGNIKRLKPGIHLYVKAKNKIGAYVEKLTGIEQKTLDEKGISFYKAMGELRKYCGSAFTNCKFVTFGDHDLRILNQSVQYNLPVPKNEVSQIQKNYFDFASFISEYIRDDNNNPLSLTNYCIHFNIPFEGDAHNPMYDALNLAKLYKAFMDNVELVQEDYIKRLKNYPKLPEPIKEVMSTLAMGKNVEYNDFIDYVKKYLK